MLGMAIPDGKLRAATICNAYRLNRWLHPYSPNSSPLIHFAVPYKREDDIVHVYVVSGMGDGRHKMVYKISTGKLSFAAGGTLNANNRSEVEATIAGMISQGVAMAARMRVICPIISTVLWSSHTKFTGSLTILTFNQHEDD